jgi:sigma-B regulation protein RsbU (phosphoserine phosphatase)
MSPGKVYGNTALRAARHFQYVDARAGTLELADELQKRPDVEVLAVTDAETRPLGIISREKLFALLGKPFGREVLGRTEAGEVIEAAEVADRNAGLFSLAGDGARPYRVLVDGDGRFCGILSGRDLSEYLSRMTQDDIELAGEIQERLEECNEKIGDERFSFDAWSRAAKGVGGDFWFTRQLEDGSSFLCLCDVSGKGVAASLVVSMVWGMLLMYDFRDGLADLLVRLNESLIATFRLERSLTGCFAIYDPEAQVISVADMGHSHDFIVRGGKALRLKSLAGNMPVGIDRGIRPAVERWRLAPGDFLFVYTDGLTEQEGLPQEEPAEARIPSGEGSEEYGEGRLAGLVLEALAEGAPLRERVPGGLDLFRGRTPQQDDMSFMALGVLNGPNAQKGSS